MSTRVYKKHKCFDCNNLCGVKHTYCKICVYRHKTRRSGLEYNIKVVNKSWFKKGVPNDWRESKPYFDKNIGYMKISIDGKEMKYHRYIMEQYLGRKLTADEVVHHRNHNKLDNNIDNLEVMTRSYHMRLHHLLRRFNKFNLL